MVGEPLPITILIYEEVLNRATPTPHFFYPNESSYRLGLAFDRGT